jgi:hypothetical protein
MHPPTQSPGLCHELPPMKKVFPAKVGGLAIAVLSGYAGHSTYDSRPFARCRLRGRFDARIRHRRWSSHGSGSGIVGVDGISDFRRHSIREPEKTG